jgi:hypothetical protein
MRVEVYWNLTRNCWSIRDAATGRIHAHADKVSVRGAQFIVQPAGRKRVLRERKKNVHAFVRGELAVFSFRRQSKGSGSQLRLASGMP